MSNRKILQDLLDKPGMPDLIVLGLLFTVCGILILIVMQLN